MSHEEHSSGSPSHVGKSHYKHLLIMTALSFIAMYALMYSMVDVFANVYHNLNQFYSVAGFLALAIAGLTSQDAQLVRAAYLAMELIGWFIIVPLSLASLLTGLIQALGTTWGLFRHWWVVIKLVLTVLATIVLLLHMQPIGHLADVVAEAALAGGELRGLRCARGRVWLSGKPSAPFREVLTGTQWSANVII